MASVLALDICELCCSTALQICVLIRQRGGVIHAGAAAGRGDAALLFELDLFTHTVPESPFGHHSTGPAPRLGVVRTRLSEICFPQAGLGQWSRGAV